MTNRLESWQLFFLFLGMESVFSALILSYFRINPFSNKKFSFWRLVVLITIIGVSSIWIALNICPLPAYEVANLSTTYPIQFYAIIGVWEELIKVLFVFGISYLLKIIGIDFWKNLTACAAIVAISYASAENAIYLHHEAEMATFIVRNILSILSHIFFLVFIFSFFKKYSGLSIAKNIFIAFSGFILASSFHAIYDITIRSGTNFCVIPMTLSIGFWIMALMEVRESLQNNKNIGNGKDWFLS